MAEENLHVLENQTFYSLKEEPNIWERDTIHSHDDEAELWTQNIFHLLSFQINTRCCEERLNERTSDTCLLKIIVSRTVTYF